jgi:protein-tyrosine phosphatase
MRKEMAKPQSMTFILDGYLYLGSRFDSGNFELLQRTGITAVVNVTPEEPNYFQDIPEFKYIRCPVEDKPDSDISSYFDSSSDFIEEMRNEGRIIFVHCRGGISRSPTIVISYLMKYRKFSFKQAYKLVSKNRRIAPNIGFIKSLENLDIELKD